MARMALAALAAVLLFACAPQALASSRSMLTTCPTQRCPSGYIVVPANTGCGFNCYTQAKLNCGYPACQPMTCGGTTGKPCPAVACAYASTYAVSGPTGCAAAKSTIGAIAFSDKTYDEVTTIIAPEIKTLCDDDPSNDVPVEISASKAADSFAKAIAKTLVHYGEYVCSCCTGNSLAYATVGADVQAVAQAQANATVHLIGQVNGCNGWFLSYAESKAKALARDTQLAIDSVYKSAAGIVSYKGHGTPVSYNPPIACNKASLEPRIAKAIADAVACTFAEIYASAKDSMTPGLTYACASSLSLAGFGATSAQVCKAHHECECKPEDYQYDNLGFETGSFDGGAPVWDTTGCDEAYVSTGSGESIQPHGGSNYMAVIPGGDLVNGIRTEFTVPPCADKISVQYMFDCNSLIFNDEAYLSITAYDWATGTEKKANKEIDCKLVKFKKSNNGNWAPLTVDLPFSGLWDVTIKAESENTAFFLDLLDSKLFIDTATFTP